MDSKEPKVVFTNAKMEQEYQRLAIATHHEDRRTYWALQDMRSQLLGKYLSGSQIPKNKIPDVYKRLFQVNNLWSLNLPPHGRVLYSIVEEEIRIVDIL